MFSKLRPKVLPTIVRAAVRLLTKSPTPSHTSFNWEGFKELESHEADFKKIGGTKWDDICLMAKAAKEYSKTHHDEEFVISVLCRVSYLDSMVLYRPLLNPLV